MRRLLESGLSGGVLIIAIGAIVIFAGSSRPAEAQNLDMSKIFRCQAKDRPGITACDKARKTILNNCTSCHAFVPIVLQQFDRKGWDGLIERHAGRVPQLDKKTRDELKVYLAANFNPQKEPPDLPPSLLKEWTGY